MKKVLVRKFLAVVVGGVLALQPINACRFLVNNDSDKTIVIIDSTQDDPVEIRPHSEEMLGDPAEHANCRVYAKARGKQKFIAEFNMTACAAPGETPKISISELEAGELPETFILVRSATTGLAKAVVAKQATGCVSCKEKREARELAAAQANQ
jgi:hypothetical protein